jgi:DnaJ-class molecular chaperone
MKDYYKILRVSKTATTEEIKRAYRKLAHQYHPDKGDGDEARFKEINEAYQVLSNPQKRAQYDQFGSVPPSGDFNWGGQQGNWNTGGFEDFGGFGFNFSGGLGDIFEGIFSQAFSQVQVEINITLTQAILGDKISLKLNSGEVIDFNISPGTQDGQTFRFRGKGNVYKRGRGDLLITTRVQIPKRLSREQKDLLEKLKKLGL